MKLRPQLLLSICLFLARPARTQNLEIAGVFPTIDHSGTLSDKWDYSLYYFGAFNIVNPPANEERERPYFGALYLEQALHYKVSEYVTLTGSYVYERQNPLKETFRNENRFYLQGTVKYDVAKTRVKHRLRYDGRYIENRVTGKTPYTNRLRYLIGLSNPIGTGGNKYVAAYNEFFFNLDKHSAPVYGENWAFAGIGFKTKKAGTFELGPLYIFWAAASEKNDLINFYYLQLAWVTYFDSRKSESK